MAVPGTGAPWGAGHKVPAELSLPRLPPHPADPPDPPALLPSARPRVPGSRFPQQRRDPARSLRGGWLLSGWAPLLVACISQMLEVFLHRPLLSLSCPREDAGVAALELGTDVAPGSCWHYESCLTPACRARGCPAASPRPCRGGSGAELLTWSHSQRPTRSPCPPPHADASREPAVQPGGSFKEQPSWPRDAGMKQEPVGGLRPSFGWGSAASCGVERAGTAGRAATELCPPARLSTAPRPASEDTRPGRGQRRGS